MYDSGHFLCAHERRRSLSCMDDPGKQDDFKILFRNNECLCLFFCHSMPTIIKVFIAVYKCNSSKYGILKIQCINIVHVCRKHHTKKGDSL